jgi:hypothetical protein
MKQRRLMGDGDFVSRFPLTSISGWNRSSKAQRPDESDILKTERPTAGWPCRLLPARPHAKFHSKGESISCDYFV